MSVLANLPIFTCAARLLPLVAPRSSSNSLSSRSSRHLKPCRAAQRHSSSPSTEGPHAAGSNTLQLLSLFGLFLPSLDSEDTLWKHTHNSHFPPRCDFCGNVKYCDDVAELLLSLPLPRWSIKIRRGEAAMGSAITKNLHPLPPPFQLICM